jgi:hypothetical protein
MDAGVSTQCRGRGVDTMHKGHGSRCRGRGTGDGAQAQVEECNTWRGAQCRVMGHKCKKWGDTDARGRAREGQGAWAWLLQGASRDVAPAPARGLAIKIRGTSAV